MGRVPVFRVVNNTGFDAWALLHAMAHHTKDLHDVQAWQDVLSDTSADRAFDVTLSINGEEVDFSLVMARLEECYDQQVKAKAEKILAELFDDLPAMLANILTQAKSECLAEVRRKFPNFTPEEY